MLYGQDFDTYFSSSWNIWMMPWSYFCESLLKYHIFYMTFQPQYGEELVHFVQKLWPWHWFEKNNTKVLYGQKKGVVRTSEKICPLNDLLMFFLCQKVNKNLILLILEQIWVFWCLSYRFRKSERGYPPYTALRSRRALMHHKTKSTCPILLKF